MKINTHADYIAAVHRANELCDGNNDPWSVQEFGVLCTAIEDYETANHQLFPNLNSNAS